MAIYIVTGKLGHGKTLISVGRIFDYIKQSRKIATNLDLNVEHLMKKTNKTQQIIRLPDKPRPSDLDDLGTGSDQVDEDTYGLIILDECGTWLNSRSWNDPERRKFIDWMLHSRKLGWDILFIIQHIDSVDKQVRDMLCEHLVTCKRLDKVPVPVLSFLSRRLGFGNIYFPKIHLAKVFYGDKETDLLVDRWTYRGKEFYPAYDTRQIFKHDFLMQGEKEIDMRAMYSLLPRWHIEGRYEIKTTRFKWPHGLQWLVFPAWLLLVTIGHIHAAATRRGGVV